MKDKFIIFPSLTIVSILSMMLYCNMKREMDMSSKFVADCNITCTKQNKDVKECNWSKKLCECTE